MFVVVLLLLHLVLIKMETIIISLSGWGRSAAVQTASAHHQWRLTGQNKVRWCHELYQTYYQTNNLSIPSILVSLLSRLRWLNSDNNEILFVAITALNPSIFHVLYFPCPQTAGAGRAPDACPDRLHRQPDGQAAPRTPDERGGAKGTLLANRTLNVYLQKQSSFPYKFLLYFHINSLRFDVN